MEVVEPPYMTNQLVELPQTIILNLDADLMPIRNLMLEFHPFYMERDFKETIKSMFNSINYGEDVDYQSANFATGIMFTYFYTYNMASGARLSEIEALLHRTCNNVHRRISEMSGYIDGMFPYKCVDVMLGAEVVLRNTAYLNHMLDMQQRPYKFFS